ncbi:hypothetical protein ABPG72_008527 [Tetrahymena utriculariae]
MEFNNLQNFFNSNLNQHERIFLSIESENYSVNNIFGLGESIEQCDKLREFNIDIAYNNIEPEQICILFQKIAKNQSISVLKFNLEGNEINSALLQSIAINIQQLKQLEKLSMNIRQSQLYSEGIIQFAQGMESCNTLQELNINLDYNQISESGAQSLGKLIGKQTFLTSLDLNFNNNALCSNGVAKLTSEIPQCLEMKSLSFKFQQNAIDGKGAIALGNSISQCKKLVNLSLDLSQNSIGFQGLSDIIKQLKQCDNLEKLEVQSFYVQEDGVEQIDLGLNQIKSIKQIIFNFCSNTFDNTQAISNFAHDLELCDNLVKLKLLLSSCNLVVNSLILLGQALKKSKCISNLNLDFSNNQIQDAGLFELMNEIGNNKNITEQQLSFSLNQITAEGLSRFSYALQLCTHLNSLKLDFYNNQISPLGFKTFSQSLSKLADNLKTIQLIFCNNNINQNVNHSLQILQKTPRLVKLQYNY